MIRYAYHDPRSVVLLLVLIVTGGVAGFRTRPKLEDPKSKVRWGYITTYFPGASPAEVESQVSEPIEKALREAQAIRTIESTSLRGVSIVFVRLTDEVVDVPTSWTKVQDKLSEVAGALPARASVPTLVDERRWDSHTTLAALVDKCVPPLQPAVLARWAKELDNRLRFVPGTRFTEVFGLPVEEATVQVGEQSLASLGLTMSEIADRIQQRDSAEPDATSRTHDFSMPVRVSGDVDDLNRLRNVVLRGNDQGQLLRVNDIATVHRDEQRPYTTSAIVQGRRAVVIGTRMDPDYQLDTWAPRHIDAFEEFEQLLPAGLELEFLFSQQRYTDQRSRGLYANLGYGMLFVIIVVCIMMGWRVAIPICAALPLTILGVFFLMIPFGGSVNKMSIAGLILALGMLIDNPIIVVDDIQRRRKAGESAEEALIHSIKYLMRPLIGANLTTMLGFAPILLIPGPAGEYLGQLGGTVIACLLVSLLLSFTAVPVAAAWALRSQADSISRRDATYSRYTKSLELLFAHPRLTVVASIVLPAAGFVAAGSLEEQFFPPAERDHFHFSVRLPTYSSILETERVARQARDLILQHDEVEGVSLFIGMNAPSIHYSMLASDDSRPDFAQGIVQLKVNRVEPEFVQQIQEELDEAFPEAQSVVTLLEQGAPSTAPIEFRLYGPSVNELQELGEQARRILMLVPGITHTRASLDLGGPQLAVHVREHDAASVGLTDQLVAEQIRHQIDGITLSSMSEENEEVPIRVRLEDSHRSSPERVFSLPIVTTHHDVVPMGSVADWSVARQRFNIHRRNSSRCNIIFGYIGAGHLPVELEGRFKQALVANNFTLPVGYHFDFGGVSQERNTAVGNLLSYAAIIVVLMVSVLVVTVGSFRQAGIIGLVGILSVGLGLLSLWLFHFPIGMVAITGLMGMTGLAINDSLVVLTDCKQSHVDPVSLAASVRHSTRHVLTTSLTTVAGVLPLILAGGDFWPPMMIVVAGGVVGATLLALGLTPAMLVLIRDRYHRGYGAPQSRGHEQTLSALSAASL